MKWALNSDHQDPYTKLWVLIDQDCALATVQVFRNNTACYWLETMNVGKPAHNEEQAKKLAEQEVSKSNVVRGLFGINKFKIHRNWLPYFRVFTNCAIFYFLFEIFDFQGDGFIVFTLCLWHRVLQMNVPFPSGKIKKRCSWRFPRKRLFSIEEPRK